MIKVYGASKISRADLWKQLRVAWPEIHFTARWPYFASEEVSREGYQPSQFWQDDLVDVASAHFVLVYAEKEDKLKGALIEAGYALGIGKGVIVVGDHDDYSTWQYHPSVVRVSSLNEARAFLMNYNAANRTSAA